MNFTNVKLILAREVRDQLRDRRTLFMIFVLPVLLYPLLGSAYFQMMQFQTRRSRCRCSWWAASNSRKDTHAIDR